MSTSNLNTAISVFLDIGAVIGAVGLGSLIVASLMMMFIDDEHPALRTAPPTAPSPTFTPRRISHGSPIVHRPTETTHRYDKVRRMTTWPYEPVPCRHGSFV